MLISLNWLKGGLQTDKISDEELVKLIGARLVEVEGVIDQTHKYDKIYIVQVKYCEAIEGTHLHLCKIDDGGAAADVERDENGYVQVCAARQMFAKVCMQFGLHQAQSFRRLITRMNHSKSACAKCSKNTIAMA